MPRPRLPRTIRSDFPVRVFKPRGVPMVELQEVSLPLDGLEALRLADAEGLEHGDAALLMGVSRPTFSRLLTEARTAVATALTNGWALSISGGAINPARGDTVHDACPGRALRRRRGHCFRMADRMAREARHDASPNGDAAAPPAELKPTTTTE